VGWQQVSWRSEVTMSIRRAIIGLCLLLLVTSASIGGDETSGGDKTDTADRQGSVTYRMPTDAVTRSRVTRSADWLKRHLVTLSRPGNACPIRVIAWKDPTLEPADPGLLAGYVITDTLWAGEALRLFDPAAARAIEASNRCLGWPGNDLHDVLFHRLDKILHRSADEDIVHGFSLGRYPLDDGRTVDVRVFRQKWDATYGAGHPHLFAEHAVYRALYDFWQGRVLQARRRVLDVIAEDPTSNPPDPIFWDPQAGILVDFVNRKDWAAFHDGQRPVCRHYTFKLGVLLYAVRLLGLETEVGPTLAGMKERLWSAQTESGGVAHFVDIRKVGTSTIGRQPTGEASAIAILAEAVEAKATGGR
jgi:hypothetical protein